MSGVHAVVLAGGTGTRMGGRKENVPVPGGTLLTRAWNAVAPLAARPFLQGPDLGPPGMEAVPDLRVGEGPLAGIETALVRARDRGAAGVVVLALDLPRVTAPVILELLRRWRELPDPVGSAVVPETRRGPQPLAAVYGAGLASDLSERMRDRDFRAARGWVDALGERAVRVPESELASVAGHPDPFLNVNRPAHVERALELPPPAPPMVSVVGWKDSGKTGVAVGLAGELRRRGYRVMALKHGHRFRLDTPGTDSHRLTHEAGVERVLLAGPEDLALLGSWGDGAEPGVTALAARYLHDADVVVVEGWKREPLPAVEIRHCADGGREPLWRADAPDRDRFVARVARDCPPESPGPVTGPPAFPADAPGLATLLADRVETRVMPGLRWLREGAGQ